MGEIALLPSGCSERDIAHLNTVFRRERELEMVKARVRQQQIARANRNGRRSIDGLGEVTMAFDPFIETYLTVCFGTQRWMTDRGTVKHVLRELPEAVVRSYGTRIQVGWNGPTDTRLWSRERGSVREVKHYAPR